MIIDLQRGIAEAGRIRIGQKLPTSGGGSRPAKLDSFRLTSADKRRIEEAAELFGGEVKPWAAPAGPQWEVITTSTELDVIVPPQAMAFSQWYELWSAGGCARRCDGQTETLTERPCICDAEATEKRACDIHTRLSLMIRDLPGLALWRLDTQGWYAARELAGAVEILTMAAGRGVLLPARLLLEQRSVKRPGANGKPQTLRFAVPRLDPGITPGELLALPSGGVTVPALVGGSEPPRLIPVPRDESPVPSIAAQSGPPAAPPARRNAAPALPSSGRRRAARKPAQPGDDGYWRARAFADGDERGIDADQMRAIAADVLGEDPDGFSMATLEEADWERIHVVVLGFKPPAIAGETFPAVSRDTPTDSHYREIARAPREEPGPRSPDEVDPETGEIVEAPAAPAARAVRMSRVDLLNALEDLEIEPAYALSRSWELFPREPHTPLTDSQRGELVATLTRERTTDQAVAAL